MGELQVLYRKQLKTAEEAKNCEEIITNGYKDKRLIERHQLHLDPSYQVASQLTNGPPITSRPRDYKGDREGIPHIHPIP